MKKQKAVEFFRVSSKRQEDGFSLSAQQSLAKRYVNENHFKVIKTWSVSESASKEKDRKHFYEMLEFVRQNQVRDVIFDKVDRACRGYRAAYLVEELISDYGVRFHFVRDHLTIDRNSPMSDRDRFGIGVWMGKRYSENLRMEVMKGMKEREKEGYWNHQAPLGYRNVRKSRKAFVEVDNTIAPFIKEAFELYATGNYTQDDIRLYLTKKFPEERRVTKGVVENALKNPFYYGVIKVKGKILKGKHQGLISKELWDNCQRIRGVRAIKSKRNDEKAKMIKPLMQFFRCGVCFSMVTGESKIKSTGKRYIYYRCANKKCPEKRKTTNQKILMKQVIESFKPFSLLTPEATESFLKHLEKSLAKASPDFESIVRELLEEKKALKDKMSRLETLHKEGLLDQWEAEELISMKKTALQANEKELEGYLQSKDSNFNQGKKVVELLQKSYDFMRFR